MTARLLLGSSVLWVAVALAVSTCALPEREVVCEAGKGSAELFGTVECDLCASRSCCEEATRCAEEPGCAQVTDCFRDCGHGDEACFVACRESIPHDRARVAAVVNCAASKCASDACPLPEKVATTSCAQFATVTDVFEQQSCDLCMRRELCDASAACANNADCLSRIECMAQCVGAKREPSCFDECRDDDKSNPGDATLFLQVGEACRDECEVGRDFSCVGQYSWPEATQDLVSVQNVAINRVTNMPFAFPIDVTACISGSDPCSPAGANATQQTDVMTGLVTHELPTSGGFGTKPGFLGYLMYTEATNDPDLWLPTLVVHTRPDYRDRLAEETAPYAPGSLFSTYLGFVANKPPPVQRDPALGVLVGGVVDCRGTFEFFAGGIVLEIEGADDRLRVAYVDANQALPDTSVTATTDTGQLIAVNVPVGLPMVTLRQQSTGLVVAQTTVDVHPGTVTVLAAWPQTR